MNEDMEAVLQQLRDALKACNENRVQIARANNELAFWNTDLIEVLQLEETARQSEEQHENTCANYNGAGGCPHQAQIDADLEEAEKARKELLERWNQLAGTTESTETAASALPLKKLHAEGGRIDAEFADPKGIVKQLAAYFLEMLDEAGAANCMEIVAADPEGRSVIVELRRFPGGKTMATLRDEAQEELKRLQAEHTRLVNHSLEVEHELQQHALDEADAAGALPVEIPEPGTDAAKLLIANVLMRRTNQDLQEQLRKSSALLLEQQGDINKLADDLADLKRAHGVTAAQLVEANNALELAGKGRT